MKSVIPERKQKHYQMFWNIWIGRLTFLGFRRNEKHFLGKMKKPRWAGRIWDSTNSADSVR